MLSPAQEISSFKAYDIRGRVPDQLNENIAYRIGRAYAEYLQPAKVVIGCDIRLSSPQLKRALAEGLLDSGVTVYDIGMCGTEEIYFATFHEKMDGGIMVTASHNPMDYNGMKLVREEAKPVSGDTGLHTIRDLVEKNHFPDITTRGELKQLSILGSYVDHITSYITPKNITPKKIVVNAGNGAAGHVIDALEQYFIESEIPIKFIKVHHHPDGHFPHGIPNPLLPENREDTRKAVIDNNASLGIAWDGDFDRCFFFDEKGDFIEGYYMVGLLAETFLQKHPGSKIIYDPRLTWNTVEIITAAGGTPIQSKTGHAFIKERMRKENAIYGGEMSAHHYFKDFSYCDSGMIPWLLLVELLSQRNKPLSQLVSERIQAYPASGEINSTIADPASAISNVIAHYKDEAILIDHTDGVSMEFESWRFNLRCSNTEPVVRLNVETRADPQRMKRETENILKVLNA